MLLHDDGKPELNTVVHGYSPLASYPAFEKLVCVISEAARWLSTLCATTTSGGIERAAVCR